MILSFVISLFVHHTAENYSLDPYLYSTCRYTTILNLLRDGFGWLFFEKLYGIYEFFPYYKFYLNPTVVLLQYLFTVISLLGILMIDVDFFKKVNDTLGHDAGDEVLKELSKVLLNSVRDSDFVVRFVGRNLLLFYKI